MKTLCILGATGSIGKQTIEVVRRHPDRVKITALTTYSNIEKFKPLIKEFKPEVVSIWSEAAACDLRAWIKSQRLKTEVLSGIEGLVRVASESNSDIVLSAVVGSVGIQPLIEAIRAKKTIALANKEALVVAGSLVMKEAKKWGVEILPVDSEHSAIFQCLKNENSASVRKIILTASGGPFYRSKKAHSLITVDDALAHPTWDMGPKITIDSASLMNKGLEAIEAHHLFSVPIEKIQIVIHPQSIVHSMVEYADSSIIAQLSYPDMRLPIQYAITYPDRLSSSVKPLDLFKVKALEFAAPDFKKFPCLKLALDAGKEGGTVPAAMNAANEIAVKLFLTGKIGFSDIPKLINKTMQAHKKKSNPSLDDILFTDEESRAKTLNFASKSMRGN